MGFRSLQHMKDQRSTRRGLAHPLRSAFRVWLPSWRLAPFDPVPVLFRTGSAHGIYPSELSPPERCPVCYHPDEPTYRFTCRCSRRRSVRPAQQASVSGLHPSRSPLRSDGGLARRSPDAPMGLALLGFSGRSLDRDFARSPLTRFADPATNRQARRRPRVSIGSRSASSAAPYLSTGNG